MKAEKGIRIVLIAMALTFVALFLGLPLFVIFREAFARGFSEYVSAISDPIALSAVRLTLLTAFVAVLLNVIFGVMVAWLVTRFKFRGREFLISVVDLPLAVSPVVAGLLFVLLFGVNGWFGSWLVVHGLKVIFAIPGILIATTFITLPFVARELIPALEARGVEEEEAALTLGASGGQTFRFVTLPNIRWALLYGVILCNARAMGEFGAVSVVSGHIRGVTNTLPLHIEILYNEYNFVGAFAASSLLASLAIVTLLLRIVIEWIVKRKSGVEC